MLKEFIKEYKTTYEPHFDEGFKGRFERFRTALCEPKFYPSAELVAFLNRLSMFEGEPLAVAVVGQFSSGKSSFLNALLGADVLPTGLVPVTAKPTYIKYAPTAMLKALYNDGREEYLPLCELGGFVDQRRAMKDVRNLVIYAPNELLKKVSFIDTPGLNSRSDADTKETLNILKIAGALVWISLADNAARKSELDELALIPPALRGLSVCLLNQKDKLSKEELARVLEHARTTYGEFFAQTLAVSAKIERDGQKASDNNSNLNMAQIARDSGFDGVFAFLDEIAGKKQDFIAKNCLLARERAAAQYSRATQIASELEAIFVDFRKFYESEFAVLKENYVDSLRLIFGSLRNGAAQVSEEIGANLKTVRREYARSKKSRFGGEKLERASYEFVWLDADAALSKLIYNDERMGKIFKSLGRDLKALEKQIHADVDGIFARLKEQVLGYKAKFESVRKSDELHSDVLFADVRKFASESYFLFVNDFETVLARAYANLGLFFEKSGIKIATNYANAARLAVGFIEGKIERARADYESDPSAFALYYPTPKQIEKRVLTELSYYEFEDDFTGTRPYCAKFLAALAGDFDKIVDSNLKYLAEVRARYDSNLNEIKSIEF